MMLIVPALLCLGALASGYVAQDSSRLEIGGVVIEKGTLRPIIGARVTLIQSSGNLLRTVIAGSDGRFLFGDLIPGIYDLKFVADGYVAKMYGSQLRLEPDRPVVVEPERSLTDLVISLSPAGSVVGHIRNVAGDLLSGVPVHLLRFSYDSMGVRIPEIVASTVANDIGEYHFLFAPVGDYYVCAGGSVLRNDASGVFPGTRGNRNQSTERYALRYFQNAADLASATPFRLLPGAALERIDFVLSRQELFSIRGRLIDAKTGEAPSNASVSIEDTSVFYEGGSRTSYYDPLSKRFVIPDLASGEYKVQAFVSGSQGAGTAGRGGPVGQNVSEIRSSSVVVNVSGKDVDNLLIMIDREPSTLYGRLRIDGAGDVNPAVRIQLRRLGAGGLSKNVVVAASPIDGAFIVPIPAGRYQVAVVGLPPPFYMRSARYGETDLASGTFEFDNQDSRLLTVTVGSDSVGIQGLVSDRHDVPVAGARVVLVPDMLRGRVDLYRDTESDLSGRFLLRSVPLGDYRVFAWEDIEPYEWLDPNALRRFEEKGVSIRVRSSGDRIDVIAIPAGDKQ